MERGVSAFMQQFSFDPYLNSVTRRRILSTADREKSLLPRAGDRDGPLRCPPLSPQTWPRAVLVTAASAQAFFLSQ